MAQHHPERRFSTALVMATVAGISLYASACATSTSSSSASSSVAAPSPALRITMSPATSSVPSPRMSPPSAKNDALPMPCSGMSPPVGSAELDPVQGGGLTALRIEDGQKVWFAPSTPCAPPLPGCSPAQPAAVTVIDGAVFSGAVDGHLRAFSTADGKLLWDVDTVKSYTTVNGVAAKGGSLDGAGPVVVDGMVYVNSGYPRFGGLPGNVLLAFGLPR